MRDWQADHGYKGWTWGIVDVPVERFFGAAAKTNITVPGRLLKCVAIGLGQIGVGFIAGLLTWVVLAVLGKLEVRTRPNAPHDGQRGTGLHVSSASQS